MRVESRSWLLCLSVQSSYSVANEDDGKAYNTSYDTRLAHHHVSRVFCVNRRAAFCLFNNHKIGSVKDYGDRHSSGLVNASSLAFDSSFPNLTQVQNYFGGQGCTDCSGALTASHSLMILLIFRLVTTPSANSRLVDLLATVFHSSSLVHYCCSAIWLPRSFDARSRLFSGALRAGTEAKRRDQRPFSETRASGHEHSKHSTSPGADCSRTETEQQLEQIGR